MSVPTVDKSNENGTGQFGVPEVPEQGGQGIGVGPGRVSRSVPVPARAASSVSGLGTTADSKYTSRPVEIPLGYVGAGLTYGFAYFAAVPMGKVWEVLRISASQADPWAAALTNALLIYRMPQMIQESNSEPPSFGVFLGSLGTLAAAPGVLNFLGGQSIYVRGMERVAIVSKALANGTQLQCSMDVIEHEMSSFLISLEASR